MRSLDPAVEGHLAAGHSSRRTLLLLDLPSGLWGFWTGFGAIEVDGVTFVGAGSLATIQGLNEQSGLSAVPVVIALKSVPDTALTPDVLATIENEAYHQRPATIFSAWLDPDTRALVAVDQEYRGYIDRVAHKDQEGGQTLLEVTLESKARDHHKTLGRVRGDADQRRIDPADAGLSYAATAAKFDIVWGRQGSGRPPGLPANK